MRNTSSTKFPYILRRNQSSRLQVRINVQGKLMVTAPEFLTREQIDRFLEEDRPLIQARLDQHQASQPDAETCRMLQQKAKAVLPGKLAHYAAVMGVKPASLRIGSARVRHGSCSSVGKIMLSWRIMAYPEDYVDYVVVHELAHLRYMNHSPAFWQTVAQVFPDWKIRRQLKPDSAQKA